MNQETEQKEPESAAVQSLTVRINKELHKKLKIFSIQHEKEMTEIVEVALIEYLNSFDNANK